MFPVAGEDLKHRFPDLTKDEFWACEEADNELEVSSNHLNNCFIDLKKSQIFGWSRSRE